jgi:hypothetical protein
MLVAKLFLVSIDMNSRPAPLVVSFCRMLLETSPWPAKYDSARLALALQKSNVTAVVVLTYRLYHGVDDFLSAT